GFEETAGVDRRVRAERRYAEDHAVRTGERIELFADQRLGEQHAMHVRGGDDGGCGDVDAACGYRARDGGRGQFRRVGEAGGGAAGRLDDGDVLQGPHFQMFADREDRAAPGDGDRVAR